MIIGIGSDIVDHNITQGLGWLSDSPTLKRVFCTNELEMFALQKTNKFISGRFAAKEAVLKCLGTGMIDGIALTDIQILRTEAGKPFIQLQGDVQRIAEQMGVVKWHISISHTENTSIAFVIAEGENK